MSGFIQLSADVLVAILLVAMIAVSVRLSRNLARLKADESAMRLTIAELIVATETAERAIVALRGTLDDGDRSLTERLRVAERFVGELATGSSAAEAILTRIDAILDKTRRYAQSREPLRTEPPAPVGRTALELAVATAQAVADRSARRLGERAA